MEVLMRSYVLGLVFAAATIGASVASAAQPTAASAETAPALVLPAIGPDGTTLPLTADQLDADERKTYAALPSGSDDARQFLYTRGFLRYCRKVVDGTLPPAKLPQIPERENWNKKFLSAHESKNVVDVALFKYLLKDAPKAAPIDPAIVAAHGLPPVDADGASQALTVEQLTAEEKTAFAKLEPGSEQARQYLYTRGYLRYCRLVIDGTIAPSQLPRIPAPDNWNRNLLSISEARNIVDVAVVRSLKATSKP
jgi:hypothetical protein